ncbi:hypothetical protein ARAF_1441 [Arsenophonus endosymbiont of Aleurodicus floccissimus]|uniref:DUF1090 domain-containing protein n=1 Tax=Arsenophonus endosymbiont of Aleurodicus floccissimus TaxID=2152761 RepID=UPI000E6AFC3A|nr:DUF1090 domain-containing protein [Arsenophonus endosymbiont of Aleurodicus floccissimus]SPP31783.1 hypothetical protein ARAF_1441 [Arsenophonus endosymbiont of Aleurodicus floccissimus]
MKKISLSIYCIAFMLGSNLVFTNQQINMCKIKKQTIQTQIEYAKKDNNQDKIDGLKTALKNLENNCSSEFIYQKNKNEVEKKRLKVREREVDLKEAQAKGDKNKISKQQQKLQQAKIELYKAEEILKASK